MLLRGYEKTYYFTKHKHEELFQVLLRVVQLQWI